MTDGPTDSAAGRAAFLDIARLRERAALRLAAAVTAAYFGFVLAMAFRPRWLAAMIGADGPFAAGMLGAFLMVAGACAVMGGFVRWREGGHGR